MTMEIRLEPQDIEDRGDRDSQARDEIFDRFYEGRLAGVGLYSEVRPRMEDRVILQELDD